MEKVNYLEADKLAGCRVDRRVRQYFATDDRAPCKTTGAILFKNAKFRQVCSGCSDDSDYSTQSKGCGCSECGGHGVVITNFPLPVYI